MLGRRRKPAPDPLGGIDPALVAPALAPMVADAVSSRRRWQDTAAAMSSGPLKDRIVELTAQVDAGVLAVWETTRRLTDLQRVAATLDPHRATADYKAAKRDPAADPQLVAALEATHRSTHRLLNAVDEVEQRLRLLDARLDAAVIRATELLLTGPSASGTDDGDDLAAVVDELQALHASLDDLRTG